MKTKSNKTRNIELKQADNLDRPQIGTVLRH
jgi:hypothetical protein